MLDPEPFDFDLNKGETLSPGYVSLAKERRYLVDRGEVCAVVDGVSVVVAAIDRHRLHIGVGQRDGLFVTISGRLYRHPTSSRHGDTYPSMGAITPRSRRGECDNTRSVQAQVRYARESICVRGLRRAARFTMVRKEARERVREWCVPIPHRP